MSILSLVEIVEIIYNFTVIFINKFKNQKKLEKK